MSEIQAVDANVAAVAPVDDLAAPRKGMWQRFEPAILGFGSIVVLLLVWELLPRLITMQEGTKLFFTVPSEIGGTLWRMFATGAIWGPLSVSASAFAIGLAIAIAVGLPVGVLLGRSATLNAMFDPFITAFNVRRPLPRRDHGQTT